MAKSRVGKRTRHLLVFVHVVVSLGWMGAGLANVVLAMTGGYTSDADIRRVCYQMISTIDTFLVIPGAFAALLSGLVLSLVTPWGLVRYWWVLSKLVLTVVVIVYSTFGLGVWVETSIAATSVSDVESPVAGPLAYGTLPNIVAFLFMTWVSVAKPWGPAPWAKQQRPRRAAGLSAVRRPGRPAFRHVIPPGLFGLPPRPAGSFARGQGRVAQLVGS